MLAVEPNWKLYSFVEDGELKGDHIELARQVYKEAAAECTIVAGPPGQCFGELHHMGDGLQLQKCDGCVGWLVSPFCGNAVLFSSN